MHDIWKRIGVATGARVSSLTLSTAAVLLSARWLGPSGRGVIAAVMTWAIVLGTLFHCSLGQVALRERSNDPQADFGKLTGSLLGFAGVSTLLAWSFLAVLVFAPSGFTPAIPRWAMAFGALSIPFIIWEQYGSYLLMSIDHLAVYNRAQVAGRLTELGALVVLVGTLGFGIPGALLATLVGQAIVGTLGFRLLLQTSDYRLRIDYGLLRQLIRHGSRLHLSAIGALLVSYVDILVVSHYLGVKETGWYQLAVQFTAIMLVVPQAAAQVLYSRVAISGADGAWPHHRRVVGFVVGLMIVTASIAAIAAPLAIRLIVGESFLPAVPVFRILLLSVIGRTIGFTMAPQWIGRGLFLQASVVTLLIGILDICLAILLIPRLGIRGVALASVVAYSVGALVNGGLIFRIDRSLKARRPRPALAGL